MKVELWYSESEKAFTSFPLGAHAHHAHTLEADARRVAIFDAASLEDAKRQRDEFIDSFDERSISGDRQE